MKYAEPIQVLANEGKMRPAALQGLLSPKAAGVLAVEKVVLANRLAAEELFAAAAATGHQLVTHRLLNLAATPAAAAAHKIDMAPVIATGRHIVVAATPLTLNFAFSDVAPGGVTLGYHLAFFTLAVDLDSPRPCLDCWQWLLAADTEHLSCAVLRDFLHVSVSFLLEWFCSYRRACEHPERRIFLGHKSGSVEFVLCSRAIPLAVFQAAASS
jgi:hypothetical protein